MPLLAPINFKAASSAYPVIPVPQGQTEWFDAVSKEWKVEPNSDGSGQHIEAFFTVNYQGPLVVNKGTDAEPNWVPGDEEVSRSLTFRVFWSLKPTGLWRTKKDLVGLGVDPAELEGDAVDLESILNELFSAPFKAQLGITQVIFTPRDNDPLDPSSPQPRATNNVAGIRSGD